ncbi:GNAT family N-acetyltransferase [Pimelobacter sp. 30-1]|uniref:GNAT family N-acetyltransferase n=1 Tax=Pimelobacter TaxID=2044 RepID=UPI001C050CDD|nr:GNAT family N-acetyltransferase [Pimelobacter sp. 30-1]MBU2698886.1 hypothetical protein [Pimelobacter sp. 30-1]
MTRAPVNPDVTEAEASAAAAERASGVTIRNLTEIEEINEVTDLLALIWGRPDNPPISSELLRALGKADNYIGGAYDGDELVGACVGFHASPNTRILHSHIAGVSPSAAGRHVGYALKLHQRAWALSRDIGIIEWTYDPLVARNAHFNLVKLGALPAEYLTNFYGEMHDVINGGDDTDRLLVTWDLTSPEVVAACRGVRREPVAPAGAIRVAVPADIESLRLASPAESRAWRLEVRAELAAHLAGGGRIVGFDRAAGYVLVPAAEAAQP